MFLIPIRFFRQPKKLKNYHQDGPYKLHLMDVRFSSTIIQKSPLGLIQDLVILSELHTLNMDTVSARASKYVSKYLPCQSSVISIIQDSYWLRLGIISKKKIINPIEILFKQNSCQLEYSTYPFSNLSYIVSARVIYVYVLLN